MTISIEWVGPTLKNKYVGKLEYCCCWCVLFAQELIYSFSLLCNRAKMTCSSYKPFTAKATVTHSIKLESCN